MLPRGTRDLGRRSRRPEDPPLEQGALGLRGRERKRAGNSGIVTPPEEDLSTLA